jgi:CheY-like chemotaxis protein
MNKILVVDDIEMNRAMLIKIFADTYTVLSAENGKEAMRLLVDDSVDLVLLDLNMPEMDGYEVITAMKSDQKLAAIPIVVETGAIDKSERRALDLGADDFIIKPFDPYIVRKRVENLIQKYVLQVDNLKQALGQAEQLNRAKSAFLSRMSHELRTPLNSVISLAALMKDYHSIPEKVDEFSDKIQSSSKYLLGVINDILDISAIENQKIVITRTPFDFRKQIESIATMFYGLCKEKNIRFDMNLVDFTEEYLFGDPMRLKEILVNLVSNAVKFTPMGGSILVRVSQLSRVDAMIKLRFEVIDTGEGIEDSRQELIFRPYTQEYPDTMRQHGGSGLGLSIVKNIVELLGGQIGVRSSKGHGCTFTVDLPFTVSKELPKISNEKLREVRALIIDDDKDSQEYGQKMMKKLGIACDIVDTGKKALALMKEAFNKSEGYDICFVDWRMPGMTGIEITKAIRSTFADDTVIVVASAYDTGEISQEAKMAGANLVVPKPMFQSTVFDLLMNITGGTYHDKETDTPAYDFSGKKILFAEDNTFNAEVLMEILKSVGFQAVRVVDGRDVCEKFELSPPGTYDAILMDIQMPYLTGHEASRHIRASKHQQAVSIPIIAVTANAFTEDVKTSLAAGMNAHVAKPIDTEQLYEVLDRFVGQTKKEI